MNTQRDRINWNENRYVPHEHEGRTQKPYLRKSFQKRKTIHRTPPKPCVVRFMGVSCGFKEEKKHLVIGAPSFTFPSHTAALKARWHTIQFLLELKHTKPGGVPFHSDDFVLVDV